MKIMVVGNGYTRFERPDRYFVNRHTADFLTALGKTGHQVTLAQPLKIDHADAGLNNGQLSNEFVCIFNLRMRVVELWRLIRAIAGQDFAYLFFPGTWSRLIGHMCRWMGKPYGVYVRGEKFEDVGADAKLLRGAAFLSVESGLEGRVSNHCRRIVPIAPMIDLTANDQLCRDFRTISNRPMRILFVGRIEEAKGALELFDALGIAFRRGLSLEARIIGGGPLLHLLSEQLQQPDAAPITLTGMISGKAALVSHYEWADIFILPSHHEGFPRVLFEAMLKSCVIITTLVGGIPALMANGRNCIAIPLRNPAAIADALLLLRDNPALMQELSDQGRQTVLEVLRSRTPHFEAMQRMLNFDA